MTTASEPVKEQVQFFEKLVYKINKTGLTQLDPEYSDMEEEVPIEIFMNWITNELELGIPKSCNDITEFTKFVENYILNNKSENNQVVLTKNKLDNLQDIIITK